MSEFRKQFIAFCIDCGVLRFGRFKTKAGRMSPYFFNAGLFSDGAMLGRLGQFYAKAILATDHPFDMLFGPAYKGIPLVASVAIALAQAGRNVPYSFNRKETKDHGEGGRVIGAPLAGRVLIVDDVISAGISVRESVALIRAEGANPCGVAIALDRLERGAGERSAVQEVRDTIGLPVVAIADLDDLVQFLGAKPDLAQQLIEIERYRQLYGADAHV
ncbi:MAG: orotate phosphoribosyltransferase [Betaproteobacteria bacterium RIFCSPLOWO2_12_FULL_62_13b]|nr:MAG: orotate phosphoribosyltransferase [Betaproteobacteria bacterium RIFCSPLOWO2_12_FULL_62_13b]